MEIYEILKKDHRKTKQLFEKLQTGGSSSRQALFTKLEKDLTLHMEGEEKLFYPPLKEKQETRSKIAEAIEEHNKTRGHLNRMKGAKNDAEWQKTLPELIKGVDHHIQEEEKEVFEKAKKILSQQQEEQIGEAFEREKQQKQ